MPPLAGAVKNPSNSPNVRRAMVNSLLHKNRFVLAYDSKWRCPPCHQRHLTPSAPFDDFFFTLYD